MNTGPPTNRISEYVALSVVFWMCVGVVVMSTTAAAKPIVYLSAIEESVFQKPTGGNSGCTALMGVDKDDNKSYKIDYPLRL